MTTTLKRIGLPLFVLLTVAVLFWTLRGKRVAQQELVEDVRQQLVEMAVVPDIGDPQDLIKPEDEEVQEEELLAIFDVSDNMLEAARGGLDKEQEALRVMCEEERNLRGQIVVLDAKLEELEPKVRHTEATLRETKHRRKVIEEEILTLLKAEEFLDEESEEEDIASESTESAESKDESEEAEDLPRIEILRQARQELEEAFDAEQQTFASLQNDLQQVTEMLALRSFALKWKLAEEELQVQKVRYLTEYLFELEAVALLRPHIADVADEQK